MKSDEVFLRHILDELDFLLKRTGGIDFEAFTADDVLRRACARSLEIIGEAVKNISPDLRKKHSCPGGATRVMHRFRMNPPPPLPGS